MSGRTIIKLLVGLVVLLAAFFTYRYLFVSSAPSSGTPGLQAVDEAAGPAGGGAAAVDDEFIRLLERLQGIKLNSDLFSTPAWKSLINFQEPLVPEPKGRRNPFSPIGFDASNPASTTAATTTKPAPSAPRRR